MKYELRTMNDEWKLEVDGDVVYADEDDNVNISCLHTYSDFTCIVLTTIPYRIDVTNEGDIWLLGENSNRLHKEPYKSLDEMTSKTVFKREV
jgi:hypothetical protein